MLGLYDNTFTANYKHFRSNRQNLHLPIEIKLFEKKEMFCFSFFPFLGCKLHLPCSENKKNPHRLSISEVIEYEKCAYLKL